MARITGIDVPRGKCVVVSLTYIYGTDNTTTRKILADAGVSKNVRVRELMSEQTDTTCTEVDKLKAEGDLRREVGLNTKRLTEIGSCRGVRHRRGLPVRGQNAKNNTRTRKGPAHAIAGRKK